MIAVGVRERRPSSETPRGLRAERRNQRRVDLRDHRAPPGGRGGVRRRARLRRRHRPAHQASRPIGTISLGHGRGSLRAGRRSASQRSAGSRVISTSPLPQPPSSFDHGDRRRGDRASGKSARGLPRAVSAPPSRRSRDACRRPTTRAGARWWRSSCAGTSSPSAKRPIPPTSPRSHASISNARCREAGFRRIAFAFTGGGGIPGRPSRTWQSLLGRAGGWAAVQRQRHRQRSKGSVMLRRVLEWPP